MKNIITNALQFATQAHEGQTRKYTHEPYIKHPMRVAEILMWTGGVNDPEVLTAALLHDTIEDCGVTKMDIEHMFGARVAAIVMEVTNPSQMPGALQGNRAFRKEMDFQHIAKASIDAQNIKLADIADNCQSIFLHDPDFGTVYAREKRRILSVLRDANAELYAMADGILRKWEAGKYRDAKAQG